jgi:hypothetical protein
MDNTVSILLVLIQVTTLKFTMGYILFCVGNEKFQLYFISVSRPIMLLHLKHGACGLAEFDRINKTTGAKSWRSEFLCYMNFNVVTCSGVPSLFDFHAATLM